MTAEPRPPVADPRPDLAGLPLPALQALLVDLGIPARVAPSVFKAVHRRPRPLAELADVGWRHAAAIEAATRRTEVTLETSLLAPDGTDKLVFRLADGGRVEGVLMPLGKRTSFCVSSQVGCAMDCGFCATGRLGLTRGLEPGEIVAQVALAVAHAEARGRGRLENLVLMGMGEPLHHYDATRDALAIITERRGVRLAPSRVRVSTVGLVPRIRQLGRDFGGAIQLALSLNAGTEATRRRLMPATRRWSLADLKDACADYPLPGKGYLMVEYVLLPGVNDTAEELDGLVAFTRGLRCAVNLIPFNPFEGAPFASPDGPAIVAARRHLRDREVPVKVRRPRGRGVGAACGQLALRHATSGSAS